MIWRTWAIKRVNQGDVMGLRRWWVLPQVGSSGRPLRRRKSQVGEAVVTARPQRWGSFQGGWREMRGESQLTPTGIVVEFVAEIDQD